MQIVDLLLVSHTICGHKIVMQLKKVDHAFTILDFNKWPILTFPSCANFILVSLLLPPVSNRTINRVTFFPKCRYNCLILSLILCFYSNRPLFICDAYQIVLLIYRPKSLGYSFFVDCCWYLGEICCGFVNNDHAIVLVNNVHQSSI